jgi:hypothetical protein
MAARSTLDTRLVKRGHTKNNYDLYKLQELKRCIKDPIYFSLNYVKVQHPVRGQLPFDLYDYQEDLIKTYTENRFSIALLPRQSGKTTCAAAFLLWKAMFTPDATILVAAHQYSGASEIMQRIRYAYEELPDFIRAGVMEYNKGSIAFDNGSRIISQATTEKTGRGLALTLIYLDEFAFVEPRIAQEFWTSISPTLSTGGSCIITSTPNSETDQFAEIWREANIITDEFGNVKPNGLGRNDFKAYTIDWRQVPRPEDADAFEKKMRAQLGDDRWEREYECQFISFEETLISAHILKNLRGITPLEQRGRVRWYAPVQPNKVYIAGLDPSMGTGGDNAAITVWQLPEFVQVAEWKHNKTDTKEQVRILLDILIDIHKQMKAIPEQQGKPEIYWSVENNSLGEATLRIIEATGEEKFPGDFVHEPAKKRKGFTTGHKQKIEACVRLKNLVEHKKMNINSISLCEELKSFVRSNRSYAAKAGQTDDIVMSSLLCIRILNEIQNWDDEIHDTLADIINVNDEDVEPMPAIFV